MKKYVLLFLILAAAGAIGFKMGSGKLNLLQSPGYEIPNYEQPDYPLGYGQYTDSLKPYQNAF